MIGITKGLRILQESQREVLSHISSSSSFSLLNNESEDKPRPEDSNRNDTKYNRDKSQERFPPKSSSARRPESKERLSSIPYDKKTIPDYRTKESELRDARSSSSYDRDKRKESSKDNSDAKIKDEKVDKDKEREKVWFSLYSNLI